jgi:hypothetical protein
MVASAEAVTRRPGEGNEGGVRVEREEEGRRRRERIGPVWPW